MLTMKSPNQWNKSLLTNGFCVLLIILGYFSPIWSHEILNMGFYGLSGAITNWLAIYMLFEKVPGLYGSGIIPSKFEEFKLGIERLIMSQFFTIENLNRFLTEQFQQGSKDVEEVKFDRLIEHLDYDLIFQKLIEAVQESPFGQLLQMFGGLQALEPLRGPFREKIAVVIRELVKGPEIQKALLESIQEHLKPESLLDKVDSIVRNRLNELTPQMVKDIIQEMIRQHLGWLVVWGGFFGAILGLIASFMI